MTRRANANLDIEKLTFSGLLELRASRFHMKDPKDFLSKLDKSHRLKRRSNGYYIFSGGALSPTYASPLDSRSLEMAFSFRDSRARFLDRVIKTALDNKSFCRMNFALRSNVIDFEALKQRLTLDSMSRETGNFGGSFRDPRYSMRISAYPNLNLVTIFSEFAGEGVKPSEIINSLLKKNGG